MQPEAKPVSMQGSIRTQHCSFGRPAGVVHCVAGQQFHNLRDFCSRQQTAPHKRQERGRSRAAHVVQSFTAGSLGVADLIPPAHSSNEPQFSAEFRRACDAQLRQLHTALKGCAGTRQPISNFSVFVRVPSSLDVGELSLQRVAFRTGSDDAAGAIGFDDSAPLVQLNHIDPDGASGADIEHVIETWLKQQARFKLPGDQETVIYPLTYHPAPAAGGAHSGRVGPGIGNDSLHSDSLHGDSLHDGARSSSKAGCSAHGDSLHDGSLNGSGVRGDSGQASADGTLLGLLVAEAPEPPLVAPIQGAPPPVDPAAVDYMFAQTSAVLLEQACECLTLACALELRAALERAALLTSQQNARSLVEQARKPLSALRTFGNMLQLRVSRTDPSSDMASGVVVQGDQLHAVLQQLQHALHPTSNQLFIRDGRESRKD